ncbi:MAG: zinc-dependent dehydrogenase [Thaumarchaeota archaeon]|nr:zinc-dependent dehydrogenase [Nitrososphaerota archaeon]
MKAVFHHNDTIFLEEVKVPNVKIGEILVEMNSCGICGSDLEKVFGRYSKPSTQLGHEPSGTIIKIGRNVSKFKVGDRVFVHHHVPCYSCHFCLHDSETMCQRYEKSNIYPCGLSEIFLVPSWNVNNGGIIKIPDKMTFDQAAMIEPLACCIRTWKKFAYDDTYSIIIFGAGATGLMHVMLAQYNKIKKITCVDINEFRLTFAKKLGVKTINYNDKKMKEKILDDYSNGGVDIIIIATSNQNVVSDAIELVRKGGKIILFGVPPQDIMINVNISKIYSKEISIITSYAASDHDTKDAFNLINSAKINIDKLITHRYHISNSAIALKHAKTGKNAIKIMITK